MIRMRSPEFLGSLSQAVPLVSTDWSQRVVANGGPVPSQATIIAMETFRLALVSNGLSSKMRALCVFVPDSLVAARTPLIVGTGLDPWTNNNFTSADLDEFGLTGNASNTYLDTGVQPVPTAGDQLCGISVYIARATSSATTTGLVGSASVGYANAVVLQESLIALTYDCPWQSGGGRLVGSTSGFVGYVSANRTALSGAGCEAIYYANDNIAHTTLNTSSTTVTAATNTNTLNCFRLNYAANFLYTDATLGFVAFHDGLTVGESSTLYNLTKPLRIDL